MSARKVCINHPSSYYSGKEQSPLHFGLSAEGYDINSIMEGFDKELWIVEVRNSKKVWTKKEHINKMTYEIPLITETTGYLRTGDLKDCESVSVVVPSVAPSVVIDVPSVAPSVAVSVAVDVPSVATAATAAAAPVVETVPCDAVAKPFAKPVAKPTAKPTDYTLFITYRIHQMKQECADNKKNYDCARYEWKEYKNKPEELRLIMIAARQSAGDDTEN
jgi:hypothetical protein